MTKAILRNDKTKEKNAHYCTYSVTIFTFFRPKLEPPSCEFLSKTLKYIYITLGRPKENWHLSGGIRVTGDHAPTNHVEALHDRLLGVN